MANRKISTAQVKKAIHDNMYDCLRSYCEAETCDKGPCPFWSKGLDDKFECLFTRRKPCDWPELKQVREMTGL
jgi:hypothetical protein